MKQVETKLWGECRAPDTLEELFEVVNGFGQQRLSGGDGARQTAIAWRGLADVRWKLDSTLARRMRTHEWPPPRCSLSAYEQAPRWKRCKAFEMIARQLEADLLSRAGRLGYAVDGERRLSDIELMAKLRHFGAALRLVDFSRGFQVPLWFACSDRYDDEVRNRDGDMAPNPGGVLLGVAMDDKRLNRRIVSEHRRDKSNPGRLTPDIAEPTLQSETFWDMLGPPPEHAEDLRGDPRVWQYNPEPRFRRIAAQKSIFLFGQMAEERYGSLQLKRSDDQSFNGATHLLEIVLQPSLKEKVLNESETLFGLSRDDIFPDIEGFARNNSSESPFMPHTFQMDILLDELEKKPFAAKGGAEGVEDELE